MTTNSTAPPKFGRAAEVRAASYDEGENSVEVVWTTGASVRRRDWRSGTYYNEILEVTSGAVRLDRLNAGAPLLDTHDDWSLRSVIGSVVPGTARIEGGKGYARVRLSNAPGDVDVVSKIRDGIIRNISVGYAIHRVEKTVKDDGSDEDWRVVDWEPLEISAVPIPADAGSQFRSAGHDMPQVEFISPNMEAELSDASNTAEVSVTPEVPVQEARVVETVTETRDAPVVETRVAPAEDAGKRAAEAVAAERKRVAEIRALGKEAAAVELADAAIDDGRSVAEFRSALLEALMKREAPATDSVRATVGKEHFEKRAELMGEALMHRADPTVELSEGAREYRGFTLMDMAREALEIRGEKTRGASREDIAARALAQRSGGFHSTSDFPIILGNVVNTTLRAGYEAAGQTFRPIVRETTVSDFKSVNRAQLGEGPAFDKVNESGEFKRGTLSESKESYKIATFGKIIAVTRQVIINDDMNAFGRVPQLLGAAAAQLESDLVWHQILSNPTMGDGVALFHANHKNLPTAAAFAVGTLGSGRALMAKQVGMDGKTVLNIRPQFLIVPVDLETKAEQELKLLVNVTDTSKAATASMRALTIISEPRLDNGISNKAVGADVAGSSTAWYLAASPSQIDTVEIAYLEGNRGLFTESRYGFDVDGMEIKARLDVGAKTLDHRGLLKNAGA
ncbi:prohead protease/major capsid protein fusion protein [Shinella sp.]|uniref:prohead protease/major capsid protein fusion protein n=1 Tax=Shinella sp. TaxID=1870904 RepID=UPI003F716C34